MRKILKPTKAQLEAMANELMKNAPACRSDAFTELVTTLIDAANRVADGAELGTVVVDPAGGYVAVRVVDYGNGPYAISQGRKWCVHHVGRSDYIPSVEEIDAWPVIYTPTEDGGKK